MPYRLEIRDAGTERTAEKIVGNQSYRLVLRTSTLRVSPRFVYVFSINSGGKTTLLFPMSLATTENRFPTVSHRPAPPEIVLDGSFEGVPPYGLDTFFLLATEALLPNPWVLEQETAPAVLSSLAPQVTQGWSIEKIRCEYVAP